MQRSGSELFEPELAALLANEAEGSNGDNTTPLKSAAAKPKSTPTPPKAPTASVAKADAMQMLAALDGVGPASS